MVSHTAIVFTRYTILEGIRRNKKDQKTYGELFFMFCEDIPDMMNSDKGKYFWDRWPGYWGKLMEQGLLNSGVDPEWAKIGGDYSSTFILEGFMAITINGVRAYKNMKTGEVIYGDTVLGSGIGSTTKGTKTASSVVEEAGATAAKGASEAKGGSGTKNLIDNMDEIAEDIVNINKKYSDGYQMNNSIENILNSASYYDDPYEQVAAVTRSITDHAFANGNKRTAFDTLNMLIDDLKLNNSLSDTQKWDLIYDIAEGRVNDVTEIANIIKGK
jgi:death-on-curing family protein